MTFTNQSLALTVNGTNLSEKIILWDNDGTIMGSKNPSDKTSKAKMILPNVKQTMESAKFNFIISGFKSPESESQDFDPKIVANKFIHMMEQLPIKAAAFSPAIGGIHCFVVIKKNNKISIIKAHEDPKYKSYIGKFKKPDIGMFQVIRDIAISEFGVNITSENSVYIGDTWHDEKSAEDFGIPFIEADSVHNNAN